MATDLALNHTDLRKLNASFEGQLVTPFGIARQPKRAE